MGKLEFGMDAKHHAQKTSGGGEHADGALKFPEILSLAGREIGDRTASLLESVGNLLGTSLSTPQREAVESVRQSGKDLLTVMNNVLDLSRIETGEMRLEAIDFDLRSTVAQVVESLTHGGRPREMKLTSLIHNNLPAILHGDPGRRDAAIMMLTAESCVESEAEGLAAGADDYILKPIEPRRLAARVKALFTRLQARTETRSLKVEDAPDSGKSQNSGIAA